MTEPRDPLERELESICLPGISGELRTRIARTVEAERDERRHAVARLFLSPLPVLRERVRVRAQRGSRETLVNAEKTLTPSLSRSTGRGGMQWSVTGVLAAAACIVLSLFWFHNRQTEQRHWTQQVVPPHHIAAATPDRAFAPITLAAYARAAAESSDEVDSLLNADAARSLAPDESHEIRALARSLDHP